MEPKLTINVRPVAEGAAVLAVHGELIRRVIALGPGQPERGREDLTAA